MKQLLSRFTSLLILVILTFAGPAFGQDFSYVATSSGGFKTDTVKGTETVTWTFQARDDLQGPAAVTVYVVPVDTVTLGGDGLDGSGILEGTVDGVTWYNVANVEDGPATNVSGATSYTAIPGDPPAVTYIVNGLAKKYRVSFTGGALDTIMYRVEFRVKSQGKIQFSQYLNNASNRSLDTLTNADTTYFYLGKDFKGQNDALFIFETVENIASTFAGSAVVQESLDNSNWSDITSLAADGTVDFQATEGNINGALFNGLQGRFYRVMAISTSGTTSVRVGFRASK